MSLLGKIESIQKGIEAISKITNASSEKKKCMQDKKTNDSNRILIQGLSMSPNNILKKKSTIANGNSMRCLKACDSEGKVICTTSDKEDSILVDNLLWDISLDREYIWIYDNAHNKVGKVKQHVFSPGIFEKEKEKCSVYRGNQKICTLKNYREIFEDSHKTESVEESLYSIKGNTKNYFTIMNHNKVAIAKVYRCNDNNKRVDDIFENIFEIDIFDVNEVLQAILITFGIAVVE